MQPVYSDQRDQPDQAEGRRRKSGHSRTGPFGDAPLSVRGPNRKPAQPRGAANEDRGP